MIYCVIMAIGGPIPFELSGTQYQPSDSPGTVKPTLQAADPTFCASLSIGR